MDIINMNSIIHPPKKLISCYLPLPTFRLAKFFCNNLKFFFRFIRLEFYETNLNLICRVDIINMNSIIHPPEKLISCSLPLPTCRLVKFYCNHLKFY